MAFRALRSRFGTLRTGAPSSMKHLGQFLSSGYISSKQAESLRGRLHWFECFAFGRIANKAISRLAEFSVKENRKNNLDKEDVKLFRYLQSRVCTADPLMLTPASSETWIIFTDGACEGLDSKQGTIGGVSYAPSGFAFSCFGEVVPDSVMDQLLQFSRNPIFELELLPILVALLLWKEHLAHAQTVFYLENDGARYCLIKARADTHWGENIIHAFLKLELTLQLKVWFGRVPTSGLHLWWTCCCSTFQQKGHLTMAGLHPCEGAGTVCKYVIHR